MRRLGGAEWTWFPLQAPMAWRYADAITQSHTYTAAVGALNLRLHNYQSGGPVSFDWARVRKAVSPAPAITVGSVESY